VSDVIFTVFLAALQVCTVPFAIESETGTVIQEQTLHISAGGSLLFHFPAQTVGRDTHCGFVRLEITAAVV
jgi:hypothetical protein